jgi:Leucine-rich repeat (LRR) protein
MEYEPICCYEGPLSYPSSLTFLRFLLLNAITQIDDYAFQNCISLTTLYLSSNHISKISSKTFAGLRSLSLLYGSMCDVCDLVIFPQCDK